MKYLSDGYNKFLDADGYPAIQPPWGTLNAINLSTGEIAWKIPFGEYPELAAKGVAITGSENYGGPVVTAGGLLVHRSDQLRQEIPRFRQGDRQTALGSHTSGGGKCNTGYLRNEWPAVCGHRGGRRQIQRALGRNYRCFRATGKIAVDQSVKESGN